MDDQPITDCDKDFYEWIVDASRRQVGVPHLDVWRAAYHMGMEAAFRALEDSFVGQQPPSES